jgi:hypothetical protein
MNLKYRVFHAETHKMDPIFTKYYDFANKKRSF